MNTFEISSLKFGKGKILQQLNDLELIALKR